MTTPAPPNPQSAGDPADGGDTAAALARLLAVASRLSSELAATQVAVQDLTAQIARASMGAQGGARPSAEVPSFAAPSFAAPSERALAERVAPAPASADPRTPQADGEAAVNALMASSLPPRRGDHAVAVPATAQVPAEMQAPPAAAPQPVPAPAQAQPAPLAAVRPLEAEWTMPAPPDVSVPPAEVPISPFDGSRRDRPASLADVPLLSAGIVEALLGPIRSLNELDGLQARIGEMPGVEAATVTAFEGQDVLMSVELDRPLPLASMLRTELNRDVESCRLVEGRIVVVFADDGRAA